MTESCAVFIQPGKATLEAAAKSLERYGLTVERVKEHLVVFRPGSPSYVIRLVNEPHVIQEAVEIGAGTEHEAEMAICSERFEIEIEHLAEALNEINTLMEVQGALQDCSGGYFLSLGMAAWQRLGRQAVLLNPSLQRTCASFAGWSAEFKR